MERLTRRNVDGKGYIPCHWKESAEAVDKGQERLAQIEDILGDTYDLDKLRELVDADKAGKIAILPVKPGDTIYQIGHKEIIPFRVGNVAVEEWGLSFEGYLEGFGVHRTMPGEKVFFTIEEANEVLERILSKEKQNGQKEPSQD